MDIEYKGANCVVISTKKGSVITDPKLSFAGQKDVTVKDALVVATQSEFVPTVPQGVVTIDQPGEYEVGDISVRGVAAKRLIDHDGSKSATMYRVSAADVNIAVIGHVVTPLDEDQLEALGVVDILIVPVGGGGYTLDSHQAVALVRQIDPRVVIPTHYADKGLKYEVPQNSLEDFVKELSVTSQETLPKYKIKGGVMPETLTLIELTRTS